MLHKLGTFLRPSKISFLVFLALMLLMPVFYIYSEPERANYSFGEEQHRITKTIYYSSPLDEYLFHTDGNVDVFLGIIVRDYFDNRVGIPLLTFYYFIACSVNHFLCRIGSSLSAQKA
jgi:hypothetical protein